MPRKLRLRLDPLEPREVPSAVVADAEHGPGCDCGGCRVIGYGPEGQPAYALSLPATAPPPGNGPRVPPFPESQTFLLESLPGSNRTIYLDFDGHTTTGTWWNSLQGLPASWVNQPFTTDGNGSTFNTAEHEIIQNVWRMMSEDFAPFEVNVTTKPPAAGALTFSGSGDQTWGIRVIFAENDVAADGAGGVAFQPSFKANIDNGAFVYPNNLGDNAKNMAEAGSHEVGHTLNLGHDGRTTPSQEYYFGHNGSGGTPGWAPIMGAGYDQPVTQWSKGEYGNASNAEDDLAIITRFENGGFTNFNYRADDAGNNIAGAVDLAVSGNNVSFAGLISTTTDIDYLRFTTAAGSVTFNVDNFVINPNLDVAIEIRDSAGTLVGAPVNVLTTLDATITRTVAAGTYFLVVEGVGVGNASTTGYSDYASLGQYTVSGTIVAPLGIRNLETTTLTFTENGADLDVTATAIAEDDATIASATIQIQGGYVNGPESLQYAAADGIAGSFSAATGMLTLTGNATPAQYTAALRRVKYRNTSENPSTAARTLAFQLTDSASNTSAVVTRPLAVVSVNDAPSMDTPSNLTIAEDAGLQTVNLTGISDGGESQTLVITAVSNNTGVVPHPSVSYTNGNSTGSLTFTPVAHASGTATITVTLTDNGGTANGGVNQATRQFTVTVTAVNDPPTAADDPLPASAEDAVRNIPFSTLTGNDTAGPSESGQTLVVTAVSNPVGGTVALGSGEVVFTPTPNYNGPASFDYVVTDNGLTNGNPDPRTDTGSVTFQLWEVNDGPTATDDALPANDEDVVRTIPFATLTGNDSDGPANESGQSLTITAVSNAFGGTAAIVGNDVVFTPTPDFNGPAGFDYTVSDDGTTNGSADPLTDLGSVTFSLTAVNDPPILTLPALYLGDEDTDVPLTGISVVDVDAPTVVVTLDVPFGTLNVRTDVPGGAAVGGNGTGSVTLTGSPAAVNATLAASDGVVYVPALDANGGVTLTVQVDDQGGTGSGGPQSASDTATINLAAVNDAPLLLVPTAVNLVEDQPFAFTGAAAISFSDVDGGSGTFEATLTPTEGTLSFGSSAGVTLTPVGGGFIASGTIAALNAALATLSFGPTANFFGAATLAVTIDDLGNTGSGGALTDVGTVSIEVEAVNDAPQVADAEFQIPETSPIGTVVGQVSATDVENDGLTFAITDGNSPVRFAIDPATGVITTAVTGLSGTYSLTITVTDDGSPAPESGGGTVVVRISQAPTTSGLPDRGVDEDAAPVVVDLAAAFADAEDADADLTFEVVTPFDPAIIQSATISGTTLTIVPVPDAFGTQSFTVRATDSTDQSVTATFLLTIDSVNDAPTIDPVGDVNVPEDAVEQSIPLTGIGVGSAFEAAAGETILSVTAEAASTGVIENVSVAFDSGTYTLRYTPVANASGSVAVTVTVVDSGSTTNGGDTTTTDTFIVTVGPVNDAPFIDTAITQLLPFVPKKVVPTGETVAGLLDGASDIDGGPPGMAVTAIDNAKGTWEYSTDNGESWTPIPVDVSPADAFLLEPDSRVRFLPLKKFKGFSSIAYKAWDPAGGGTAETQVDTTTGSAVFSAQTERGWVGVKKTKFKFTDDGATLLKPVKEDAKASRTFKVSKVLGIAGLESLPLVNLGLAVTNATTAAGTWQFKLAKTPGSQWTDLGNVSEGSALLLRSIDLLRFVPSANAEGDATLVFKTWSGTSGQGTLAAATGSAFGVDPGRAFIDILPLPD